MTESDPDSIANINRSGAADLNARRDITVGGDVVGRDKITQTIINEAPRAGANLLHQLPAPPADFTGREKELTELLTEFEQGVTISGLQGQGGVGKTAVALCLAVQLMDRYPDAQIFLDLKGVSGSPLAASGIMAHVVRSFDLTAKLSEDEAGLAAAYHCCRHRQAAE